MKLIPRQVVVTGSFKAFGFRDGMSSGTDLSMTCDVPDGMSFQELTLEIYRARYTLDMMALKIESGKGMIPPEVAQEIASRAKNNATELINAAGQQSKSE